MILVTGATGNVGREIVAQLADRGVRVRALARNAAKAAALAGRGVEIAGGDLDRPESLGAVLRGIDRLLLATGADPRLAELQGKAIAAAKRWGVQHVVRISALGAADDSPSTLLRLHARADEELRRSGLAWTLIQPNFFMQNFLGHARAIASGGALRAPAGDGRASVVDLRDVAAVAAAALLLPGHESRAHVVTGPEPLSHAEIAAILGTAIGRPVPFVDLAPREAEDALIARGTPPVLAHDRVVLLHRIYGEGRAAAVSPTVAQVTGGPPRRFAEFAAEFAAAFAGRQVQAARA